jgi:hypothetical protein
VRGDERSLETQIVELSDGEQAVRLILGTKPFIPKSLQASWKRLKAKMRRDPMQVLRHDPYSRQFGTAVSYQQPSDCTQDGRSSVQSCQALSQIN